ncbi:putative MFS transporter, AGZA family, xanthine/uracil permease [Microbulbifer donghaiensis]|uniref:Putative MFS transporter, AGZA family, xanthine/uracil permease n=1 Tax=Microbulbifer donghaiensis TaxID=494016 RepID=A0A1M5FLZ6_9GAMM|nr:NCS2 family permease [Microbulbifer donghaiensis]SHF92607.1 putative MFS transporter, AGZA family, xanthine/uracil permease [Microbulbifer donghaiensis]
MTDTNPSANISAAPPSIERPTLLERFFKLSERDTTVRREVIAGVTTFLTMAYIIFVNPNIMAAAGMDKGAVFTATCLAAAIGCLIMGIYANYPFALAPGMGLNAFFSFVVVGEMGYSWQVALGAVFISGVVFLLLSIFRIREWIIDSIPMSLRQALAAGVGLFLAIIALKSAGIVVASPATLVTLGDLTSSDAALAALGFFLIAALAHRRMLGAVMIGILVVTVIALLMGKVEYAGLVSAPPSMAPTFMQLDIAGAFEVGMISVIFAFLFVDLFDTAGTLLSTADRAKLLDKKGQLPGMGKALMADSSASAVGSLLGSSTTTTYVESTAGVAAGGRTGLTAVVCAGLFLLALFFSPLVGMVPAYATAGALMYVAVLMTSGLSSIDWDDITEAAPAVVAAVMMPLSFSIANGIALGFIAYAVIKTLSGRSKDVSISVYLLAALFIAKFIFF